MRNEEKDPFVDWIKRWRRRFEQIAFFLFIVLDFSLILFFGLSILVQHYCKFRDELQNIPTVEVPVNNNYVH